MLKNVTVNIDAKSKVGVIFLKGAGGVFKLMKMMCCHDDALEVLSSQFIFKEHFLN